MTLINRNQIFPMKSSKSEKSRLAKSYDKIKLMQIVELRCRKVHGFQTINNLVFKYWLQKLKTRIKVVSKYHVPNFNSFWEISRQRTSRSGRVGSGRFIILNDWADPTITMTISFNFLRFLIKGSRAVWMSSSLPIRDC